MAGIKNPFTPEQVREWESLRASLIEDSKELNQKIDALNRALGAAQAFSGMEALAEKAASVQDGGGTVQPTLVDAITAVLTAAQTPLSHKQIKAGLPNAGFGKGRLLASPNYYYTALNRLVEQTGPIQKTKDKKFYIKNSEAADDIFA